MVKDCFDSAQEGCLDWEGMIGQKKFLNLGRIKHQPEETYLLTSREIHLKQHYSVEEKKGLWKHHKITSQKKMSI